MLSCVCYQMTRVKTFFWSDSAYIHTIYISSITYIYFILTRAEEEGAEWFLWNAAMINFPYILAAFSLIIKGFLSTLLTNLESSVPRSSQAVWWRVDLTTIRTTHMYVESVGKKLTLFSLISISVYIISSIRCSAEAGMHIAWSQTKLKILVIFFFDQDSESSSIA